MDAFKDNSIRTITISSAATSIESGVFEGNQLTRISLPANMKENNFGGLEAALINFYKNQKNIAGIYQKKGQIWTKITAAEAEAQDEAEAAAVAAAKAKAEAAAAAAKEKAEAEAAAAKAEAEAKAKAQAQLAEARVQIEAALKGSVFTASILEDNSLEITGYTGKEKNLVIPGEIGGARVKAIGPGAFRQKITAGVITSVVIPDTVETIGVVAFSNMLKEDTKPRKSKLASLTLGAGLKEIGEQAFLGNTALKTVVFKSSPALGKNVFTFCGLTSVTLPSGMANVEGIEAQLAADYKDAGSSAGVYVKARKRWSKKS
jgi:uncharacterized membrane protein YqiK